MRLKLFPIVSVLCVLIFLVMIGAIFFSQDQQALDSAVPDEGITFSESGPIAKADDLVPLGFTVSDIPMKPGKLDLKSSDSLFQINTVDETDEAFQVIASVDVDERPMEMKIFLDTRGAYGLNGNLVITPVGTGYIVVQANDGQRHLFWFENGRMMLSRNKWPEEK